MPEHVRVNRQVLQAGCFRGELDHQPDCSARYRFASFRDKECVDRLWRVHLCALGQPGFNGWSFAVIKFVWPRGAAFEALHVENFTVHVDVGELDSAKF
jgi:hypothetical protein